MGHLLMIAFHFPPSSAAGTYRSMRFAKYLQSRGWRISVLTVKTSVDNSGSGLMVPEGTSVYRSRVLNGMSFAIRLRNRVAGRMNFGKRSSEPEGSFGPKRNERKVWQKIKDNISLVMTFPDKQIGWCPSAVLKGLSLFRKGNIDVIYSSGPPHSSHLIAWSLKSLTSKPWVADFRDPWSRQLWLKEHEKQAWRQKANEKLERFVVNRADHVILNTERMREEFSSFYGQNLRKKFICIPNGYDPEDFQGVPLKKAEGPFRLTHAGNLYRKRNPLVLLEALQRLIEEGFVTEEDIQLEFIGSVSLEGLSLEKKIQEMGLQKVVKLSSPLPHRECLLRLHESDALLVVQPEADVQIPGKIFEYMYLEKPIFTLAHPGATAEFVMSNRLGWVANPDKPDEVIGALRSLYNVHIEGKNESVASQYLLRRHDARTLAGELDAVLANYIT